MARNDASAAADGVAELGSCLTALGARREALFPQARRSGAGSRVGGGACFGYGCMPLAGWGRG